MITFAVIKPGQISLDMGKPVMPLLYTADLSSKRDVDRLILDQCKHQIEFVQVPKAQLMDAVCEELAVGRSQLPENLFYHTYQSLSTSNRHLEILTAESLGESPTVNDVNALGCLFSLDHRVMYHRLIVLANQYRSSAARNVDLTDLVSADIARVIRRRYYHSGLLVADGQVQKYHYQNPEYLAKMLLSSYTSSVIELFGYRLRVFTTGGCIVNESVTRVMGQRVNGPALVIFEAETETDQVMGVYGHLSRSDWRVLDAISYGPSIQQIVEGDNLWNRYLLTRFMYRHRRKTGAVCQVCYRYLDHPVCPALDQTELLSVNSYNGQQHSSGCGGDGQ